MTHATEEVAPDVAQELAPEAADVRQAAGGSTLIEFPGARNVPQWRKELSERVREIQQRKAREAAVEPEEAPPVRPEPPASSDVGEPSSAGEVSSKESSAASRLGLVPPLPDAPEMNPLVAAALKRIERARQQTVGANAPARGVGAGGRRAAATAVARVAEERYEAKAGPQVDNRGEALVAPAAEAESASALPNQTPAEAAREAARRAGLVAVPTQRSSADVPPSPEADRSESKSQPVAPPAVPDAVVNAAAARAAEAPAVVGETEPARRDKPAPRRVAEGVIDDAWLSRLEERILPPVNAAARTADDIAPVFPRLLAGLLDLLMVVILSSPFAAVIELTSGNWADARVAASMGGIALVLMFLYLTVSTALAGRTCGMTLFGLHTVDAETALAPSLGQCVRRTLLYIVSLATFGLGILYALFDAERRAAHDHLSGTVVVRH